MEQQATWPGWETIRLIGRGSFGAVYEIQRNVFEDIEKAALKVISIPQNASDIDEMYSDGYDEESITSTFQSHLKSIVAEYSLMRKMNGSANIVNCDDIRYVQHDDGIGWDIFIKMELLTPLPKALPVDIPEETVIKIAKDMCAALELCKKHEIVHRDIKPQNIFVSPNGDFKLGDFGIAKTVEKTMGGTKIGTYKYMAPEVYNNQPYGSGADIYSLGLVLYWLLNERRMPFLPMPPAKLNTGMEESARQRRFSGEALPAPVHGSDALKAVVLKACAFDPKRRYSSATEILADLKKLESGAVLIPPVVTTTAPVEQVQPVDAPADIPERKENAEKAEIVGPATEEKKTEQIKEEKTQTRKEEKSECVPPTAKEKPRKKRKIWMLAVAGVLLAIVLLCLRLCSDGQRASVNDPTTTAAPPATTTTAPETVYNYRIRVVDQDGNPIEGAYVIFCLEQCSFYKTNAEGWALIDAEIANGYKAHIMSLPAGYEDYTFSEEYTYFESGQTEIILVATKPAAIVANVVGKTEAEAKATLEGLGFKVTVTERNSDTVAEGKVISQSVTAGTQLVIGSEIQLTVSSGKKAASVANVVGKTKAQAKSTLEEQGFEVKFKEQNSDTVAAGKVISQSPEAGSKQYAGTTVTVVISKGPATMTVSLDANGGEITTSSVTVTKTHTYGALPTPSRDYYTFAGWYTSRNGGTLVTDQTTVTSSENHTLYARWTLNPLSDWVLASQVPSDAKIVNQKWTYTLTSYTTSTSSTLNGWILYDTTSEWGSYGAWSEWSTTAVTETDSRDVETKNEHTGYKMVAYNTMSTGGSRQFRGFSIAGKYSDYGCRASYGEHSYSTTATVSAVNSATKVAAGAYTSACTYPGWNKDDETGYILSYSGKKYVFFISSKTYTTYYRYRDRSLVYTYYFYKEEAKESTTEVTASDTISNVQKWVRYRPK